jgi:hypothetical protein
MNPIEVRNELHILEDIIHGAMTSADLSDEDVIEALVLEIQKELGDLRDMLYGSVDTEKPFVDMVDIVGWRVIPDDASITDGCSRNPDNSGSADKPTCTGETCGSTGDHSNIQL